MCKVVRLFCYYFRGIYLVLPGRHNKQKSELYKELWQEKQWRVITCGSRVASQGWSCLSWAFAQNLLGAGTFHWALLTWPKMSLVLESLLVQKLRPRCFHLQQGVWVLSLVRSQEPICCAGTVKNIKKNESQTIGFIMASSRESQMVKRKPQ